MCDGSGHTVPPGAHKLAIPGVWQMTQRQDHTCFECGQEALQLRLSVRVRVGSDHEGGGGAVDAQDTPHRLQRLRLLLLLARRRLLLLLLHNVQPCLSHIHGEAHSAEDECRRQKT